MIPQRCSQDKSTLNKHGKDLLRLCQTANLVICNGRTGKDKNAGNYTCFTARRKSVVDYLISCLPGLQYITNFLVDTLRPDSDHCPLLFTLGLTCGSCCNSTTFNGDT